MNEYYIFGFKTLDKALKILFLPLSLVLLVLIRIISPFVLIRYALLPDSRIGHFVQDVAVYLCNKKANRNMPKVKYIDLFCLGHSYLTSNSQIKKIWKKKLNIVPNFILIPIIKIDKFLNKIWISKTNHQINLTDFDQFNLVSKLPSQIKFDQQEKKRGFVLLERMGIPKNAKFVILIVRDSRYLKEKWPKKNWEYHNFRDTKIESFKMVAEKLTNLGFYVVRMGSNVKKSFPSKNSKIIDYALSGSRSEFMDIFLCSYCHFCVSTGTGLDNVARVSKRPVILIGLLISDHNIINHSTIFIPQHYYSAKKNKKIPMRKIIELNADHKKVNSNTLKFLKIRLKQNSPQEIADVVIEFVKKIGKRLKLSKKDKILQDKFWKNIFYIYKKYKIQTSLNLNNIQTRVSSKFLRQNKFFLD